jgi:hypothetical protein
MPAAPARPRAVRKTLSAPNLALLGAERLAGLLLEVAAADANWRRRLRLELAAEMGAAELAGEIDKRLQALAASRARVSWRKRPELVEDLEFHRRLIVERLAKADPAAGLKALVDWMDLYPDLERRVRDPKGELADRFLEAAADLGPLASAAPRDMAGPLLFEALQTRLSDWARWVGRTAPGLSREAAADLLARLTEGRPRPTGKLALVVRRLADRIGDATAFAETFAEEDRRKPDIGAEIARRLAQAGQAIEARAALEASRPRPAPASRWGLRRGEAAPELSEPWMAAEIAVLDAEGQADEAQARRWQAFERTLDPEVLRAYVGRLPDFDDVEALDRAFAHAAVLSDPMPGLTLLMEWPALPEAARMIRDRAEAIRGSNPHLALWAARLQARFPEAALILLRARAAALARLGPGFADEVLHLAAEAEALAGSAGPGLPSHADFLRSITAAARR